MAPNRVGRREAGESGRQRFREFRSDALRRNWRSWSGVLAMVATSATAIVLLRGPLQVAAGFVLGVAVMTAMVGWVIGGEVWSLPPLWGAIGEEQTADVLSALDPEWWVGHDFSRAYGNYDHVVIGPPGVFLLDSKRLSRPGRVQRGELRAGGMRYRGATFLRDAASLSEALGAQLPARPWVQAVVVVWGKLEHETREVERVVYVQGHDLLGWLRGQPQQLSRERRERIAVALGTLGD